MNLVVRLNKHECPLRVFYVWQQGIRMKLLTTVLTIFSLSFLSSCENSTSSQSVEIFPLKQLSYTDSTVSYAGDNLSINTEYFVIANAPDDKVALREAVESYNKQTLSVEETQKYYAFFRMFYRETDAIGRDYVEKHEGYFSHDRIEHHGDDRILVVKWENYGKNVTYEFE